MSENCLYLTVVFPDAQSHTRLDTYLSSNIDSLSRSQIQNLIKTGCVLLNGNSADKSAKVYNDDRLEIRIPLPTEATHLPQNIPIDILYEDENILVLNKPSGLVVHPAAGNYEGTLVNALLAHCKDSLSTIGGEKRPGIVHRLDKNTSGVMVVAKNNDSHKKLAKQFEKHTVTRKYLAFCWGRINQTNGICEGQIGRSTKNRQKMTLLQSGGRYSCTYYKVICRYRSLASKVECSLKTGRTHQVRVHMQSLGHPIIGDKTYGRVRNFGPKLSDLKDFLKTFDHQALHAYYLSFNHPASGKEMIFNSPIPLQIQQLEQILETH